MLITLVFLLDPPTATTTTAKEKITVSGSWFFVDSAFIFICMIVSVSWTERALFSVHFLSLFQVFCKLHTTWTTWEWSTDFFTQVRPRLGWTGAFLGVSSIFGKEVLISNYDLGTFSCIWENVLSYNFIFEHGFAIIFKGYLSETASYFLDKITVFGTNFATAAITQRL